MRQSDLSEKPGEAVAAGFTTIDYLECALAMLNAGAGQRVFCSLQEVPAVAAGEEGKPHEH